MFGRVFKPLSPGCYSLDVGGFRALATVGAAYAKELREVKTKSPTYADIASSRARNSIKGVEAASEAMSSEDSPHQVALPF